MTWRLETIPVSAPLADWMCTEDEADELGAEGLMWMIVEEDPMAAIEHLGGLRAILRFADEEPPS